MSVHSDVFTLAYSLKLYEGPEDSKKLSACLWKHLKSGDSKILNETLGLLFGADIESQPTTSPLYREYLNFLLSEVISKNLAAKTAKTHPSIEGLNSEVLAEARAACDIVGHPLIDQEFVKRVNPNAINSTLPLLKTPLDAENNEWQALDEAIDNMSAEYNLRRSLVLTRFTSTVRSFLWSEEGKKKEKEILGHLNFNSFSKRLSKRGYLISILTSNEDDCYVKKIASIPPANRSQSNALTKYKVGRVPDRGGRPNEQAPPPPEMPSWQQRQAPSHDGGRGGGGFRGRGGGHHNRGRGGEGYHQNSGQVGGGGHSRGGGGGYHQNSDQVGGGGHGGGGGGGYRGGGGGRHRGNKVQGAGWNKSGGY